MYSDSSFMKLPPKHTGTGKTIDQWDLMLTSHNSIAVTVTPGILHSPTWHVR